jgi:hypothetical protein
MKKIYLSFALMVAANSFSQKVIGNAQSFMADRTFTTKATKTPVGIEKAEGDTLWIDGFTNASNWTQSFGTGHTSNATGSNPGWVVVNSLPANVTGQQADYQWPATFSAATGNFALINSDDAGANIQQDAYFALANSIDLTAAGNSALYLCFNEYYRNYYDGTFVEVSIDGGTNWVAFEANPESVVPVNTNCTAGELEIINITSVIGTGNWTNQVKIRFHYTGDYDWFWGVDNVRIVEAWDNDVQVYNWYAATDISTTQGLDYFVIDDSQSSFPGLTFGALANNNGGAVQASVALKATATGGYNQTGASISMNASATDSLSITTPYIPTGLGTKTIDLTTVITPTDANLTNNTESLSMLLSANEYSRDNGTVTGSIGNVTSNTGNSLKIGNIMDIFNNWTTTGARLYLPTQATAAVGAEYWVEAYLFNGTNYGYLAETERKTVTSTASTWSSLKWTDGLTITNNQLGLTAGDDILLLACHTGGTTPIRFGMAQNTYEGSVLGYVSGALDTDPFSLLSPGAIMVRFTDDASVGLSENATSTSLSVYPNPSSDVVTIESNMTEGTIQIIDLTGKVVANQTVNGVATAFNTAALSNGMYTVILTNGSTVETRKFIVQH